LSNLAITVDGDKADARTYFDALIMAADTNPVSMQSVSTTTRSSGPPRVRIARRQLTTVRLITVGST